MAEVLQNKYPDQSVYTETYFKWETDPESITLQLLDEYESGLTLPTSTSDSDKEESPLSTTTPDVGEKYE